MRLEYIELRGFKSFAKPVRLEFGRQITAIVGPNGSGKSNIAEAFRFVLGEQSMKSLRSRKTEDLLFNGSSMLQRVNRAVVKLSFDNSKGVVPSSFTDLEIERIIHRDSTNEYYINGSQARLKDVTEMLAAAQIGSAGHHIISQGEADKMLSMTSRERKEYLEEALGLVQYQNKRIDALKKLQKTHENLESVRSLVRELAPHVRYLEKEMKLIEKKKELSAELIDKTRHYVSLFRPFMDQEEKGKGSELVRISGRIKELESLLSATSEEAKRDEHTKLRGELQQNIDAVSEKWNALRREKGELERSLGRLEVKIELLSDKASITETPLEEIPGASNTLRKVRDILYRARNENEMEALHSLIEEALNHMDFTPEKAEDNLQLANESEVASLKGELESLRVTINERLSEEDSLLKEKRELERRYSETFQNEERKKSEAEKFLIELKSAATLRDTLQREVASLKQEEEYFLASIKEVMLLTGARFSIEYEGETPISSRDVIKKAEHEVERLKLRIEGMQVGNTKEVETEYTSAKEREAFLMEQVTDLEITAEKLIGIADDLHRKIETEFKEGVVKISGLFSTFFSQMFHGGSAGLKLVTIQKRSRGEDIDEEDAEKETGVDVSITMPHKKLRSITMLSGGEKTLVSIALIFALSQVNPPPFLILDETDAALDEANSRRYGEALKELSKYSQLILITHNRETMSKAGMLYGITMGRASTSELLSIDLEEAEKIVR